MLQQVSAERSSSQDDHETDSAAGPSQSVVTRRFRALLEAAGLASAHALAVALELDRDVARSYYYGGTAPPRVVVLAVERLVDLQLADQITAEIRRNRSR